MTQWIITSSLLILIILLMRTVFKGRLSPRIQYVLWAIVLIRLLIPGTFSTSRISVMNVAENYRQEQSVENTKVFQSGANTISQGTAAQPVPEREQETPDTESSGVLAYGSSNVNTGNRATKLTIGQMLAAPWIVGIAVILTWFAVTNLRFGRELRRGRIKIERVGCRLPVYVTEVADTPMLFGIFKPAIYVTPRALESDEIFTHVLEHELTHCRHGDNIWAVLRCVAVALHWYNPLVWLAASISLRDAELACDEGTVRRLGEEKRMEYGRTLIGFTVDSRPIGSVLS